MRFGIRKKPGEWFDIFLERGQPPSIAIGKYADDGLAMALRLIEEGRVEDAKIVCALMAKIKDAKNSYNRTDAAYSSQIAETVKRIREVGKLNAVINRKSRYIKRLRTVIKQLKEKPCA